MKLLPVVLVLLLLPACAARSAQHAEPTDIFDYPYEFTGEIAGRPITGSIDFHSVGPHAIRYTLMSEIGLCTGELRPPPLNWVQLSCGGMSISFARGGKVQKYAATTLRTTRQTERRECRGWTVTNGQRVCSHWATVVVDVPVTARGTLLLQRVSEVGIL